MSVRTTTAAQRVDMLLAQAEKFAEARQNEEALERARQAIALAERERSLSPGDVQLSEQLGMREIVAEQIVERLGGRVRDRRGRLTVRAEDAAVPESWAA